MKISIDTKDDSPEDIRKIIRMLSSFIGEKEAVQSDIFAQESELSPQDNSGFVNMFENANQETKEPEIETKPKEELDLDLPGLEEY